MRRVISFVIALAMFTVTAAGIHVYDHRQAVTDSKAFGVWTSRDKFSAPEIMRSNITDRTLMIMGSSELTHKSDTLAHPVNFFDETDCDPLLIGAGYTQSLFHAINVAAIGDSLKDRRVILIVSPSWFKKSGVVDVAYASRFSESEFTEMLKNDNISDASKTYMIERTNKMLQSADPAGYKRVLSSEKIIYADKADNIADDPVVSAACQPSLSDRINFRIYNAFNKERALYKMSFSSLLNTDLSVPPTHPDQTIYNTSGDIDWSALHDDILTRSASSHNNQFYMDPDGYRKISHIVSHKKNKNKDPSVNCYASSPEYGDFKCFLQVCNELGIEVNVFLLPLNGYWYDYMGYGPQTRSVFRQNVADITAEYGARLTDFSAYDFTKYFFEDGVHLDEEGWLTLDEKIYEYFNENKEK